jgi:hypothetical protein
MDNLLFMKFMKVLHNLMAFDKYLDPHFLYILHVQNDLQNKNIDKQSQFTAEIIYAFLLYRKTN